MHKTLFITELKEKLNISADKARTLCEKLLECKILVIRPGGDGTRQQATKKICLAPGSTSKINEFVKNYGGTV
jgi:hypothetical protein